MMLNILIAVARGLIVVSVLIFVLIGAAYGGVAIGEANRSAGYVIGGIVGFCISAVVFGVAAAILDMQKSLRVLADAARHTTRQEALPAPPLALKTSPALP